MVFWLRDSLLVPQSFLFSYHFLFSHSPFTSAIHISNSFWFIVLHIQSYLLNTTGIFFARGNFYWLYYRNMVFRPSWAYDRIDGFKHDMTKGRYPTNDYCWGKWNTLFITISWEWGRMSPGTKRKENQSVVHEWYRNDNNEKNRNRLTMITIDIKKGPTRPVSFLFLFFSLYDHRKPRILFEYWWWANYWMRKREKMISLGWFSSVFFFPFFFFGRLF